MMDRILREPRKKDNTGSQLMSEHSSKLKILKLRGHIWVKKGERRNKPFISQDLFPREGASCSVTSIMTSLRRLCKVQWWLHVWWALTLIWDKRKTWAHPPAAEATSAAGAPAAEAEAKAAAAKASKPPALLSLPVEPPSDL